jgi:hypothetical protein
MIRPWVLLGTGCRRAHVRLWRDAADACDLPDSPGPRCRAGGDILAAGHSDNVATGLCAITVGAMTLTGIDRKVETAAVTA